MKESKTAEGLRDRLFETLDAVIEKKIDLKDVEAICFISEQILKTARIEIDTMQEIARIEKQKRDDNLMLIREQKESVKKLEAIVELSKDLEYEKAE